MCALFGKWARTHTQRLSHLCHLEPEKYRTIALLHKLLRRLEKLDNEGGEGNIETSVLKNWIKERGAEKYTSRSDLFQEWNQMEKNRKRRIPTSEKGRLNSCLRLKESKHRNLCTQWFFGRFPRNPATLEEDLGQTGKWCNSALKEVMAKSQWTKEESGKAAEVINTILYNTE